MALALVFGAQLAWASQSGIQGMPVGTNGGQGTSAAPPFRSPGAAAAAASVAGPSPAAHVQRDAAGRDNEWRTLQIVV